MNIQYVWEISPKKVSNANLKQTGLNGYVCDFSVNLRNIDVGDILDIH